MYIATRGGFFVVPKPVLFVVSTTTEPENTPSLASNGIATGCSFQCTRSVLVAWPQDMLPQTLPSGLYWKKRW